MTTLHVISSFLTNKKVWQAKISTETSGHTETLVRLSIMMKNASLEWSKSIASITEKLEMCLFRQIIVLGHKRADAMGTSGLVNLGAIGTH